MREIVLGGCSAFVTLQTCSLVRHLQATVNPSSALLLHVGWATECCIESSLFVSDARLSESGKVDDARCLLKLSPGWRF